MRRLIALSMLALGACAPVETAPQHCSFPEEDAAWAQSSVAAWSEAMAAHFDIEVETLPQMIVLGPSCVFAAGRDAKSILGARAERTVAALMLHDLSYPVYAAPLDGAFHAPSGQEIEPAPLAFTAPDEETGRPFFMIASTEIWRSVLPADEIPDIAGFIKGIAVHELVHTEHAPIMTHLDEILSGDPELADVSDEWLHEQYQDAPGYKESIAAEKASLIAALRAGDVTERRRVAGEAARAYRDRQRTYYGERYALFRNMEDTFLTMEGVAVWLAFQAAPPEGAADGGAGAIADYFEAGGGGSWVQAEGGLMAAVIESLAPSWRARAFAPEFARLPDLLEAAAAGELR